MTIPSNACAALALTALALLGQGRQAEATETRAVIELFTSQGCSSCPPADELLAVLAKKPGIIALSMPVDYWDYLGWKDTFAQHAFTERQRAYSLGRGDRQVYTPQAVINGRQHANGADPRDIETAIAATAAGVEVPVQLVRDGQAVKVSVGAAGKPAISGRLVAMSIIGRREVAIGRGANARRKVTYTNIVRSVVPLGDWSGTAKEVTIPASALADADSVVVVVQAGSDAKPGAMLGAAQLALR